MMRFLPLVVASLLFPATTQARDRGTLVGYIAAFQGLDRAIDRNGFGHYTQLDLAFVNPTLAGEMVSEDGLACAPNGDGAMISSAQMRRLVAAAHQAGAKVVASLGGATIPTCGGDWNRLLAPQTRQQVVTAILGMVDRYQLDGADIDLEGELLNGIDRSGNYTPFVRALADALHARSKILTAATGSYSGGMIPDSSLPLFDLIGVMSYDAVGPTWGTPGGEHSTYAQAQQDLALWISKGVPAAKLALGVPFYGHGFGEYARSWSLQEIMDHFGSRALAVDVAGNRCGGCSYVTYNGLGTLKQKAILAGAWGTGVMVWQIGQDLADHSGSRALDDGYDEGRAFAHRD